MIRTAIGVEELGTGELATAISSRFASANVRMARIWARLFAVQWLVVTLTYLGESWRALLSLVLAVALLWLARRWRKSSASWHDEPTSVGLVVGLLLAQQVAMVGFAWGQEMLLPALILPPVLGLFFQLVPATRIALHASWFGLGLLVALVAVGFGGQSDVLGTIPATLLVHAGAVVLGLWRSRAYRRQIVGAWDAALEIHEDRLRMRRELETARQIQLSMLPRHGPALAWVDWASLSLPATEVGGDYYEHRVTEDGGLVVTIADVAGHGLASGLLLSGLRASLALLEDVEDPAEVFERLHRMVRRTRHDRAFVTLAQLRLEADGARGELVVAGHPPMLVAREDGRVEEVGGSSTPLGAMRELRIQRQSLELGPNDVLLLSTDGAYETVSPSGEALGIEGLAAALAVAVAEGGAASTVRDSVLRRVWEHKGEARQEDDLTMVVVSRANRVAIPGGAADRV